MTSCPTHKRSFNTYEQAVQALLEARVRYDYPNGAGPVSVYKCGDCGLFHLTSKGPPDENLIKQLTDGKIDLHKEANHWLAKFKHR